MSQPLTQPGKTASLRACLRAWLYGLESQPLAAAAVVGRDGRERRGKGVCAKNSADSERGVRIMAEWEENSVAEVKQSRPTIGTVGVRVRVLPL